jgi:hypothetical protein
MSDVSDDELEPGALILVKVRIQKMRSEHFALTQSRMRHSDHSENLSQLSSQRPRRRFT